MRKAWAGKLLHIFNHSEVIAGLLCENFCWCFKKHFDWIFYSLKLCKFCARNVDSSMYWKCSISQLFWYENDSRSSFATSSDGKTFRTTLNLLPFNVQHHCTLHTRHFLLTAVYKNGERKKNLANKLLQFFISTDKPLFFLLDLVNVFFSPLFLLFSLLLPFYWICVRPS